MTPTRSLAAGLSLFAAAALGSAALVGQGAKDASQVPPLYPAGALPNASLTPGDTLPNVTIEQVSAPGYAQTARDVPQSEKDAVYAEYGVKTHAPHQYEIDHLISLCLGGSNRMSNLWVEPYSLNVNGRQMGASEKDKLEDFLWHQLQARKMTLEQAQQEIRTDWTAAYRKRLGEFPAYGAPTAVGKRPEAAKLD